MNFKSRMVSTTAVVHEAPETGNAIAVAATEHAFDGEAFAAIAKGFAARIDKATLAAVETAQKGKEDWQGGPIAVLAALQDNYGEELNDWPEPDSDTGNNPDKFKLPVTDTSGKTSMRDSSFYLQFTDATIPHVLEEIAFCKRANNVEAIKDGIPEAIVAMTATQRDDRVKFLDNRRSTARASYKKAMKLYFQLNAVAELPTVGVDFIYVQDVNGDDTSEVVNSPNPIIVWAKPGEDAKGNPRPIKDSVKVSIGAFLKFDAGKASENGGTFKALLKTAERKPKTPDGAAATDTPAIKTIDTFVGRFVETFRFMDEMQSDPDPKDLGKFYNLLKHKDGGELVVSVVEFRNYLDDVISELQLNAKYAELVAKKSELVKKVA